MNTMTLPEFKSTQNSLERTIHEISSLISLPEIYLKFRRLMDSPHSSISEFSEVVSCDPNMTAAVLKIVNSAFIGLPRRVDNIDRAIVMLGIGQLHDMVLALSAMESLALPNDIVSLITFWRRSLFSGILARLLALQLQMTKSHGLFVIGLLHEIGHLVIYSRFPGQAKLALQQFYDGEQTLHLAEHRLLGFHYGEVGSRLMAKWKFPLNFQQITYHQPTPEQAGELQTEAAILHVAHGYAYKNFNETELTIEQLVRTEVLNILNLSPEQIDSAVENALEMCSDLERTLLR